MVKQFVLKNPSLIKDHILIYAIKKGRFDVLKLLLKLGSDIDQVDDQFKYSPTPRYISRKNGYRRIFNRKKSEAHIK